ncbi:hypothetical protein [Piscinibacter sp. HJYY11]|uniref:hypothetical protein n=1 Tax=Piscinibacter sp. HJYY11 TaxID=2801333 RepID=UPI00191F4B41|nr:hypothetical protein [Piscinibacter sp. HJYY11]MBL0730729.1 hypothetical protein [Piscinibacter sp. HJYY11]
MHKIGDRVPGVLGNFTILRYIETLGAADLERTIGFHAGRLASGFSIAVLAPGIRLCASDIRLLGSTRWSGGRIGKTDSQEGRDMGHILEERGQDTELLKTKVCTFLNAGGQRAAAKVLPFVKHEKGMLYPDAEALAPGVRSGVPQFDLVTPHDFVVARVYMPS